MLNTLPAGGFLRFLPNTCEIAGLRTKDEAEARSLLNAKNEAQRQPTLNLHLARAYLTASDLAFVERTWQTVMEQLQSRGKDSSRERYASVFKSPSFDGLRNKKLLETTADDFFAVFKQGKVAITYFLKRLHNFALSLGWVALPVVAPYLWPKYEAKDRRGITPDEHESILAIEKKVEWKLFLELLWETGAAQGDAAAMTAEDVDWTSRTITYFRMKTGSRAQFTISKKLETVLDHLPTTGALFPKLSTFTANAVVSGRESRE
jgi:integrase